MGRALPATSMDHCVEINITNRSNGKKWTSLRGRYYLILFARPKSRSLTKNINTSLPTNPAARRMLASCIMLAIASPSS